jgi:hypothetical protein
MKTLILAGAILAAGGLVAAGVAGRFSEDIGTRLHRECESISRQVPGWYGAAPEDFIRTCIVARAGLR